LFDGWLFGMAVAFGSAAGTSRSGRLVEMPAVLSRIPELVMPPELLVMPPLPLMVALLPLMPGLTVCWLWPVCCAMAVVLNTVIRLTARVIFFIASSA